MLNNVAYILGGGITAAAMADLLKQNYQVIVLEKDSKVGGMVRTRYAYGINHEFGPHVLYGKNDFHKAWWGRFVENRLQDYYVRLSIDGKLEENSLYDFPISKLNLERLGATPDKVVREGATNNFEEFMINRVGKEAYEAFIKNYNIKQWGIHPIDMSSEWASFRPLTLKEDSPTKMFGDAWAGHPGDYNPVFDQCFEGTTVIKNERVIGVELGKDNSKNDEWYDVIKIIVSYTSEELGDDTIKSYSVRKGDIVINTTPIDDLFEENTLTWRGIIKFFVTYNKENLMPSYSVTFPNNYSWTRILEYPKHSGIPSHGCTLLSYAVPFDSNNDIDLLEKHKKAIDEITEFSEKILKAEVVQWGVDIHSKVYPISTNKNMENLKKSFSKLSSIGNMWSIGRLGIYAYISMSRAVDMAHELFSYLSENNFRNSNKDKTEELYKALRSELW